MHLVPFGEYVPLRRALFFVAPLVEGVSDFSAGEDLTLLPVEGHPVSVAICYEVVFPHLVRDAVRRGSQLLVTLTNDAWYGTSSAPFQHFEQARLRAIEQGRYLVRAANTGISGVVDPYGRVVTRSALFEPRALVGQVRFLEGLTVYGTIGDSLAWACAAVSLWLLLSGRRSAPAYRRH
jgi:apolipoprotein N-acyltransferase